MCEKISLLGSPPTLPLGFQTSVTTAALPCALHAAPRLAVFGRPSAPWPGVPALRIRKVLVLTSCRARGLRSPPGCPPLQHVPGSGGLRLGCRASRASVGRGGSPADALCGKRLRLPALRIRSWSLDSAVWGEVRTMSAVAVVLVLCAVLVQVIFFVVVRLWFSNTSSVL